MINTVGFIGLGVMGANLVQNMARNGVNVSVFNRTAKKTEALLSLNLANINGYFSISELVQSIPESNRTIFLMVEAGKAVDDVILQIIPYLKSGDVIVDLGNSHYKDTLRRETELLGKEINFIGCGVSGGEKGALLGPSIMPSGNKQAVEMVLPILELIAAKDFSNLPCVTNIGNSASGHFVKMVHNGIEYTIMQAISEIYGILLYSGYTNQEMIEVFEYINSGKNNCYLLDITLPILKTIEPVSSQPLLDLISPIAKAKGTGRWTVESALELGVAVPSIAAAVFARIISAKNQSFQPVNHTIPTTKIHYAQSEIDILKIGFQEAMKAGFLQGFDLISHASEEYGWNINLKEVARIWQGGCIIRSQYLLNLYDIWNNKIDLFAELNALRKLFALANLPIPVLHSVIDYYLSLSFNFQNTRIIQAQRDYFGSHEYQRIDQEGKFTGGWE